jgi:hypothetical protein
LWDEVGSILEDLYGLSLDGLDIDALLGDENTEEFEEVHSDLMSKMLSEEFAYEFESFLTTESEIFLTRY